MKLILLHDALVWYGMVFVAYGPPQRPVFGPGSVVRLRCWSVRCLEVSVVFLARKGGLRGGTGFLAISSRVAGLPLLLFFFCFCFFAILPFWGLLF